MLAGGDSAPLDPTERKTGDERPIGRLAIPMAVSTEERRIVTVLFADMAGSAALGGELGPEGVRGVHVGCDRGARAGGGSHRGGGEGVLVGAGRGVFWGWRDDREG